MPDPTPLERSIGALAPGDDATPLLGPPRHLLPRVVDVDDDAVGRLAAALDLGRLDDDETPLLEVVAEALAAAYAESTFATAGRLIEELEQAGYQIRPTAPTLFDPELAR